MRISFRSMDLYKLYISILMVVLNQKCIHNNLPSLFFFSFNCNFFSIVIHRKYTVSSFTCQLNWIQFRKVRTPLLPSTKRTTRVLSDYSIQTNHSIVILFIFCFISSFFPNVLYLVDFLFFFSPPGYSVKPLLHSLD